MKPEPKFVEACEALAQAFEDAGQPELSALCDRAAYWLNGGNGLDTTSISEVVSSCHSTLTEALETSESVEVFMNKTIQEIVANLQSLEGRLVSAAVAGDLDAMIDRAARLQALALLTSNLFGE